jgi:hypothetical protein
VDPERFTAGDVNFYRAVGNDPTSATDPTGMDSEQKPRPTGDYTPWNPFPHLGPTPPATTDWFLSPDLKLPPQGITLGDGVTILRPVPLFPPGTAGPKPPLADLTVTTPKPAGQLIWEAVVPHTAVAPPIVVDVPLKQYQHLGGSQKPEVQMLGPPPNPNKPVVDYAPPYDWNPLPTYAGNATTIIHLNWGGFQVVHTNNAPGGTQWVANVGVSPSPALLFHPSWENLGPWAQGGIIFGARGVPYYSDSTRPMNLPSPGVFVTPSFFDDWQRYMLGLPPKSP